MERIKAVRYILFTASVIVTFMNLVDCINKNSSLDRYLFYVVLMLIMSLLLLFVNQNWIILFVLSFVGLVSLLDMGYPNTLNAGVLFVLFAIRVSDNKIFSLFMYLFIGISVTVAHVFNGLSPADLANSLVAYTVLCSLDSLILKRGE